MNDFSIKSACEKCGGTNDLDGLLNPYYDENGKFILEQATLCKECRDEFMRLSKETNVQ